MDDWMDEQIDE